MLVVVVVVVVVDCAIMYKCKREAVFAKYRPGPAPDSGENEGRGDGWQCH